MVDFSQPLTESGGGGGGGDEGSNDGVVTYRVGGLLPVIIWDAEQRKRRVVKMRWGFPDPRDWRRPRPIHARSETIDDVPRPRDDVLRHWLGKESVGGHVEHSSARLAD